jgi:DNA invertase Pin-like site-specific DNA recombinase
MKVAIYTRISTAEQNPMMQKQQILDYCKIKGFSVYNIYEDVISGKKDSRPEFDRLLFDMRNKRFDAIAVYKLDRIGRSLQHLLQLFQEFKNRNIDFISVTQNINTDTPEGELMLRVLMILAEFERSLIASRTKDTLNNYREQIDEKGYFVSRNGKKLKKLGRPKGSKDKDSRKKSGYYRRWEREKHKKSTPRVLVGN